MKFITDYCEFGGNKDSHLHDNLQCETENKDLLLAYLKNGYDDGVRCSNIYDYVKNVRTSETVRLYTDGEYFWDSEEIYHFEKYDIKLDATFVHKVMNCVEKF